MPEGYVRSERDERRGTGTRSDGRRPHGFAPLAAVVAAALLAASFPADPTGAVLIDSGDGTGNTTAPADDPGWANAGKNGVLSTVYLGNRWVIIAHHTGVSDVTLGGVVYPPIVGSYVHLTDGGSGFADLGVYRIMGDPSLPDLDIATSAVPNNSTVTMIGNGISRGPATSWNGFDGWEIVAGPAIRWGENRVSITNVSVNNTTGFGMEFNEPGHPRYETHEAISVVGDSGGGVFRKSGGAWYLQGIMIATGGHSGQPGGLALYGNISYAADLSAYRSQILAIIEQPSCSDGLDDDGDGNADYPLDQGCTGPDDTSERDGAFVCDDGVDNDGDGAIDYPADPECTGPLGTLEAGACGDLIDNDGDGLIDAGSDPGCSDAFDDSEQDPALICDDGIDNDNDGFTDYPDDKDCIEPVTPSEEPIPLPALDTGSTTVLGGILFASGSALVRWGARIRPS
jgi:hypothetical protein